MKFLVNSNKNTVFKCILIGFAILLKIEIRKVLSSQQSLQSQYMSVLQGQMIVKPNSSGRMPDMHNISVECPKNAFFFSMNPDHMKAVYDVNEILKTSGNTATDVLNMAMDLRNHSKINMKVWYYALSGYSYENYELQGIYKPSPVEVMPDVFIKADVLKQASCKNIIPSSSSKSNQNCIMLDENVGVGNGIENRLWYFREDIAVNSHHWFFHLAYPFNSDIRKDRRGELFYYIHHSMLARYNSERFSNYLQRTTTFPLYEGVVVLEGYVTNLMDINSGKLWADRRPFSPLVNIIGSFPIFIDEMELVQNRILKAIANGFVIAQNQSKIPLTSFNGIDILGDIIQASNFSVNPKYYGFSTHGLHNNGHIAISLANNSDWNSSLPRGVMSDEATAMRDILFYRWHTYIDGLFDQYKRKLRPYQRIGGEFPLLWNGVEILNVQILSSTNNNNNNNNVLETFWNYRKLRLNRGLDLHNFIEPNSIRDICVKHLDHKAFSYRFVIQRLGFVTITRATIRIFLAPRFQENGRRFTIKEQRPFFFVLDTFTTSLQFGRNIIQRKSIESSLTIPHLQTVDALLSMNNSSNQRPFCGCGWPQHLLLPKGTTKGMIFDLFVMVTNGDDVQNTSPEPRCRSAPLFCGIPNQKYPDAKPMGYPFDRLPYNTNFPGGYGRNSNLDQYIQGIPNMATRQVMIRHIDSTPFN